MPSEELSHHNKAPLLQERYHIKHLLKEKGFVRVFMGLDLQTDQKVLIKDLCWRDVADWKSLELFEREVKNLTYLNHPFIPKFVDHFQNEQSGATHYYLVSEYIEGETLAERLDKGWKVSETIARTFAKELLDILIYLHHFSPPVIHRDIKPQNIILNAEDKAYLIDFDAVKDLAKPGDTVVGTFGYMAPEQFSNQVKPASDLYALGVTLVQMLSRCSPDDIPRKDLHLDYHDLVNTSPEFLTWLDTLVEPMLSRRCTSAEQALKTLENPNLLQIPAPENTASKALQSPDLSKQTEVAPVVVAPKIIPLSAEPIPLPSDSLIDTEHEDGLDIYIPADRKIKPLIGDWLLTWSMFAACEAPIYWISTHFLPFWLFQASFVVLGLLGIGLSVDAFKNTFLSLGITIDKDALLYEQKWLGRFGTKQKSQDYKTLSLIDFTDVNGIIKFRAGENNLVTNLHTRLSTDELAWARDHMLSKIKEHVSEEHFQRLLIDPEIFDEAEAEAESKD